MPATAPIEPFIAVADLLGWNHGCDLFKLQDAADDIVRPLQDRPVQVDRETLTLGYAGRLLARSCGTPRSPPSATASTPARCCSRSGAAGLVGGQEDMIVDIALTMLAEREGRAS